MPPKSKRKRASLKLDTVSGQIKESEASEEAKEKETAVRQVVEVVDESAVPEAIETIKKDADEIEEAVETIEEEVKEEPQKETKLEEVAENSKGAVESLFVKSEPWVNPEITVVGKRGASLGVWVGAMLGVALAIGVSLLLLVRGPSIVPFIGAQPTPTPTPTIEPTPSPTSLNRGDIKVSVINGGGTSGAGGRMKTFLEEKGYIVVSVGNADEYSYEQTEILVKSGQEDYQALLTEDLKADYSLGTSSATVAEDAGYDAQVIVGKEE